MRLRRRLVAVGGGEQLLDERGVALLDHANHLVADQVAVLFQKALDKVEYLASEVPDPELHRPGLGPREVGVALVLLHELLGEPLVRALREVALVIEHVDDARGPLFDQLEARPVVAEVDLAPVYALAGVLLLLEFKDVLVEVKLQCLIGVVDTELLEAVDLEVLEPEDVEDPDALMGVRNMNRRVDSLHQPPKVGRVERLSQRVPGVCGLVLRQRRLDGLAAGDLDLVRQHPLELLLVDAQHAGHDLQDRVRVDERALHVVALGRAELHVAEVHHGRQHAEDALTLDVLKLDYRHGPDHHREVVDVILFWDDLGATPVEVRVVLGVGQVQIFL